LPSQFLHFCFFLMLGPRSFAMRFPDQDLMMGGVAPRQIDRLAIRLYHAPPQFRHERPVVDLERGLSVNIANSVPRD
jgi:hypothetical protein